MRVPRPRQQFFSAFLLTTGPVRRARSCCLDQDAVRRGATRPEGLKGIVSGILPDRVAAQL
jgi:hypothetical protein